MQTLGTQVTLAPWIGAPLLWRCEVLTVMIDMSRGFLKVLVFIYQTTGYYITEGSNPVAKYLLPSHENVIAFATLVVHIH
jgi:hypothetical protein